MCFPIVKSYEGDEYESCRSCRERLRTHGGNKVIERDGTQHIVCDDCVAELVRSLEER